jgi:hypothetical protein
MRVCSSMSENDNPFAEGTTIIRRYGNAKPNDTHLASRISEPGSKSFATTGNAEQGSCSRPLVDQPKKSAPQCPQK